MSNPAEQASQSSLIPKRQFQPSRQVLSHKMRLSPLPETPPTSLGISEQAEQSFSHQNTSSRQGHEEDDHSLISELATVKYEAIPPRPSRERKNRAIGYPATVSRGRFKKGSFRIKITSFFLR